MSARARALTLSHAQVARELRKTSYRPRLVTLSGRNQACIHVSASRLKGGALNAACRNMVRTRSCRHHTAAVELVKAERGAPAHPQGPAVLDIEELVALGRREGPCPYFVGRESLEDADLVLLPYTYLLDPLHRRALKGIDWSGSAVIFDEAHNVESVCAEVASFDLSNATLAAAVLEAQRAAEALEKASQEGCASQAADISPEAAEDAKQLVNVIKAIERAIAGLEAPQPRGLVERGSHLHKVLAGAGIDGDNIQLLIDRLDSAADEADDAAAQSGGASVMSQGTTNMQTVARALRTLHESRRLADDYVLYVRDETDKGGGLGATTQRVLSYWCFNPGAGLSPLLELGVNRVLLASGTLAPLESMAAELALPFPVRLENPHVVDPSNVLVGVLPVGPSGATLNSSYRTRNTDAYKRELGNALVNLARTVPDGLLVFFPSYTTLSSALDFWKESGQWERIMRCKHCVVEPRSSGALAAAFAEFNAALNDKGRNGAAMFAVCRGKVSEGLDFADRAGRCVVVTGIPYAPNREPRVQLKRDFLDKRSRERKGAAGGLSGDKWYSHQAMRAVNQAVGRVIRHRFDYGAILLADERFGSPSVQANMSTWLRPHMQSFRTFGEAQVATVRFFKAMCASKGRGSGGPLGGTVGAGSRGAPSLVPRAATAPAQQHGAPKPTAAVRPAPAQDAARTYALALGSSAPLSAPEATRRATSLVDLMRPSGGGGTAVPPGRAAAARHASMADLLAPRKQPAVSQPAGGPPKKVPRKGGLLAAAAAAANAAAAATEQAAAATVSVNGGSGGQAAAESAPPAKGGSNAGEYIAKVKGSLSGGDYGNFKDLLKAYRKGDGNTDETLRGVVKLLRGLPELLHDFGLFVPAKHAQKFAAMVEQALASE